LDNPRGPFVAVVDLMRSPPDLIVSAGPEASLQAVVGATGFVPVVMIAINFDPLERGYIASLAAAGRQYHWIGVPAIGAGAEAS
jgi:hypothetical protein